MNHMTRTPVRLRHPPRLGLMRVTEVSAISPLMRRIVFEGAVLDGFLSASPDDHVKIFFPHPGQSAPELPVLGDHGPIHRPGAVPPAMRDYTPRRFDPATGELTLEFVLHGHGPAAAWARQAAPGQMLGIGGPRGSTLIQSDYDTYLLAGDETALPAIARFLEEMEPGVRALVLIEAADAREIRHLPSAASATISWLCRDGAPAGRAGLLEAALRGLMLPAGATHAWLAGEIDVVRRMRTYLMTEEGLAREQIRAAGYWRLGGAGAHERLDD